MIEARAKNDMLKETDPRGAGTARLSIAICTCNRPTELKTCLESFRSQSMAPFEIVVSDDSNDRFAQEVKAICETHRAIYRKGPRKGLYSNRNAAALACSGSHILTSDDDHTHPAGYIESALDCIATDPERVWIFGERLPGAEDVPQNCPAELGDGGVGVSPADTESCAAIADGSTIYPAVIFSNGKVYEDAFTFGNLWYLLGWELKNAGYRISYSEKTYIFHHMDIAYRAEDHKFLRQQLLANLYVFTIYCCKLRPSPRRILRLVWYALRSAIQPRSITGYRVSVRLSPMEVMRTIMMGLRRKKKITKRAVTH